MIQRKLKEAEAALPPGTKVPRVALVDMAYPRSQAELEAMGGLAAVLLTVICRDSGDLPVTRVEMASEAGPIPLAPVLSRTVPNDTASTAFGKTRFDGVYLMPVFMTRRKSTVTAFLSSGGKGLGILEFPPLPADDYLPPGLRFNWPPYAPRNDAMRKLIDEEFPAVAGVKFRGTD